MVQDFGGLFFPRPGRGFGLRGIDSPHPAAFARKSARDFCKNREARVFAAAENDAETLETGLARTIIETGISTIVHPATGTGGEAEPGTICGVDGNTFQQLNID